jgi:hypothetical protein
MAADLLRLFHEAAAAQREMLSINTDDGEDQPEGWRPPLDRHLAALRKIREALVRVRGFAPPDRERLKAAIREEVEPLLPRPHDERSVPVVDRAPPVPTPTPERTPSRRGRGKNIDALMLQQLANDRTSAGWSSSRWARELRCSPGTVKETKTWKGPLKAVRALLKAEAVERVDRSRGVSNGCRPST